MNLLDMEMVSPGTLFGALIGCGVGCFALVAEAIDPVSRPRTAIARRRHFHGNVSLFAFCLAACAVVALAPRSIGGQLLVVSSALAIGLMIGTRVIGLRYPGIGPGSAVSRASRLALSMPVSSALVPAARANPAGRAASGGNGKVAPAPPPYVPPPECLPSPGSGTAEASGTSGTSGAFVDAFDMSRSGEAEHDFDHDFDHDMTIAEGEHFDSDDTLSLPDTVEPESDRMPVGVAPRRGVAVGGRPSAELSQKAVGSPHEVAEPDEALVREREALEVCRRDLEHAQLRRTELELRVRGQDIAIEELRERNDRYREIARDALDKVAAAVKTQRSLRQRLEQERRRSASLVTGAATRPNPSV